MFVALAATFRASAEPRSHPMPVRASGSRYHATTVSKPRRSVSRESSLLLSHAVQAALRVSSPADPAEREAAAVASAVARMPAPPTPGSKPLPEAARAASQRSRLHTPLLSARTPTTQVLNTVAPVLHRQARNAGPAIAERDVAEEIRASLGGGSTLPPAVRSTMEPRFGADFGAVRVHTGTKAARLAQRLGARAFTYGKDVFFGRGEFDPASSSGRELIAHELTHTIQQRATVQREADVGVTQRSQPLVQRLGLSDILDGLAELAANVPGYTLLTLIIGRNPINLRAVERNVANVLRAFMGLIPGGEILFQVLQRYGVMQRLGDWVTAQVAALGLSFQTVRDAFTRFTDSLGWRDIFSPSDVWRRARSIFTPLIERITAFASRLVAQAIAWLKETFMQPLADFGRQIPGYGIVTVMRGRDPFTNAALPRSALNIVRAFAEFIPGGTERVDQLVQSGALERAYAWFRQETAARNLTWERVSATFAAAWASLQLADVLHPIDTLQRIVRLFRPLLGDLVGFAGAALMKLLELIYEAAMGAGGRRILDILMRARATFLTIIRDPVGFLRNLLGAVGQGVRQFMANILAHLRDGVIAWLTGPVARAGIQMPERWDLRGIIWFVLQILGLTWTRVREKLVRLLGERIVAGLEAGFQLLQEIRQRGLVQALRERVSEFFGNLRDAALGAIRSFIQQRLVMAGITQLLSMLNPVGAIIQAIIKTYTTIQFFIQRINQILDLVESIVNSIAAIASGAIGAAANFVERTMARTIPVILDFLARFIGLGDVGAQVQTTIRSLQQAVDRMLDRAVEWIRNQARNLASRLLGGDPSAPPQQRLQNGVREGTAAVNRLSGNRVGIAIIRPVLAAIRVRHAMQRLDAEPRQGRWAVVGVVNPTLAEMTTKLVDTTTAGATRRTYDAINSSQFGTRATVTGLTTIGAQNRPSAENTKWLLITKRLFRSAADSFYYVRGHLINGTFGGPGDDWRNLTPLTQTANNRSIASMLSTFETPVRNAVAAGGSADIDVRAVYGSRGFAGIAQRVRTTQSAMPGRNATERAAIADLIAAEDAIPTAIEATATVKRPGQPDLPIRSRTENTLDTDLTRYWHRDHPAGAAAPRREVNLDRANAATLQTLVGVDATTAARIISRRPAGGYLDRDGFLAAFSTSRPVAVALWHDMSSTAGVRLVFG